MGECKFKVGDRVTVESVSDLLTTLCGRLYYVGRVLFGRVYKGRLYEYKDAREQFHKRLY